MKQESIFNDDIALAPPSMALDDLSIIENVEEEPDGFGELANNGSTNNFVYEVASSLYSLLQNINSQNTSLETQQLNNSENSVSVGDHIHNGESFVGDLHNDFMATSFPPAGTVVDTSNSVEECSISMVSPEQSHRNLTTINTGSSLFSATFNYINCIVGAGAIGLGGAFAQSGGFISVFSVSFFAFMVKLSTDLVIKLSLDSSSGRQLATYEDLGLLAYGQVGRFLVMGSKFLYSFGCLVAYTKVIQDNFGTAVKHLLYGAGTCNRSWLCALLGESFLVTYLVSAIFVLPLCLLREMSSLARFSILSIIAMVSIIGIVCYFWIWGDVMQLPEHGRQGFDDPASDNSEDLSFLTSSDYFRSQLFYHHWVKIRWWGYFNNIGTFVFSFVCQHTSHLTFTSLRFDLRTMKNWKKISTYALFISTLMSLSVGLLVYMTFWEDAVSDIFQLYPASMLMDVAKLLLCATMVLTFPLPFLTCRELLVTLFYSIANGESGHSTRRPGNSEGANVSLEDQENIDVDDSFAHSTSDLRQALLTRELRSPSISEETHHTFYTAQSQTSVHENNFAEERRGNGILRRLLSNESLVSLHDTSVLSTRAIQAANSMLIPGRERQLKMPYHVVLTCKMWFAATSLAVASPSLGDILSLIGCATGTLIAFILPGLFALKLQGFRALPVFILVVGGLVGIVGTSCSVRKLFIDIFQEQTPRFAS